MSKNFDTVYKENADSILKRIRERSREKSDAITEFRTIKIDPLIIEEIKNLRAEKKEIKALIGSREFANEVVDAKVDSVNDRFDKAMELIK